MREFGLIEVWLTWNKADANRCIGQSKGKRIIFKSLTKKDLIGPGLILIIGYCVAFVVFLGEKLYAFTTTTPVIFIKKVNFNV